MSGVRREGDGLMTTRYQRFIENFNKKYPRNQYKSSVFFYPSQVLRLIERLVEMGVLVDPEAVD